MNLGLVERQAFLAGIALLAAAIALALAAPDLRRGSQDDGAAIEPVAEWSSAVAAPRRIRGERRSSCGQRLTPESLGLMHPVLPCGVKIFVRYGNAEALTQVIDRGPPAPGREFELTAPLASRLGLRQQATVSWSFAQR